MTEIQINLNRFYSSFMPKVQNPMYISVVIRICKILLKLQCLLWLHDITDQRFKQILINRFPLIPSNNSNSCDFKLNVFGVHIFAQFNSFNIHYFSFCPLKLQYLKNLSEIVDRPFWRYWQANLLNVALYERASYSPNDVIMVLLPSCKF